MSKIKVIPCSGIGKTLGLLARETALNVTDRLRPDTSEAACLAYLVTGEDEAVAKVKGLPCVTVDGCASLCAAKSARAAGGLITQFRVMDALKDFKGKDAGTGSALTDDGWLIVDAISAQVASKVDELYAELHKEGATNG